MNRRTFLATSTVALSARALAAQDAAQRATRAMPAPRIKDVRLIATAPAGLRLSVVKIITDQDGLYGYGCATFTQRAEVVNVAVEKYLRMNGVTAPERANHSQATASTTMEDTRARPQPTVRSTRIAVERSGTGASSSGAPLGACRSSSATAAPVA